MIGTSGVAVTDNKNSIQMKGALLNQTEQPQTRDEKTALLREEGGDDLYNYCEWLGVLNEPEAIILSSRHHYYYEKEELRNISTIITVKQLNQIKNLGEFFQTIFRLMPFGSKLIISFSERFKSTNSSSRNGNNGSGEKNGTLLDTMVVKNPVISILFDLFDTKTHKHLNSSGVMELIETNSFKVLDKTELNGVIYLCIKKADLTKNKRVYISSPHMSGSEMNYIKEAFEQNWVAPLGPHVDAFEKAISDFTGVKNVAVLSSGTSAIHLALITLGVTKGDYVLASTFTFAATVNPVRYLGATPVLIDSEPGTWNMDPDLLEKAIIDLGSKGIKPKAIIPVHLYGMPANMERIMSISDTYSIPVIEDAAEALGSKYKGQSAGSFGKVGIFSFNGNKIITTSGGGALVSNDKSIVDQARFLASQAKDPAPHYQHSQIGYNYRMSNIIAGIGLGQMEVIDDRVHQRRSNNGFYFNNLKEIPGITVLREPDGDYFSNYWLTTILIDKNITGISREQLLHDLELENIETRPLWKPMHMQPVFADCPAYTNGTSEHLFEAGLCLPSGSNMTESEKNRIMSILLRKFRR